MEKLLPCLQHATKDFLHWDVFETIDNRLGASEHLRNTGTWQLNFVYDPSTDVMLNPIPSQGMALDCLPIDGDKVVKVNGVMMTRKRHWLQRLGNQEELQPYNVKANEIYDNEFNVFYMQQWTYYNPKVYIDDHTPAILKEFEKKEIKRITDHVVRMVALVGGFQSNLMSSKHKRAVAVTSFEVTGQEEGDKKVEMTIERFQTRFGLRAFPASPIAPD
jgi:hypothetical protein